MGVLAAPYQQLFEVNKGIQSLTVTFKGTQKQFEWLEISLVYDKSYQHLTIYDSYDLELAAKMIQSIKFENTVSTYSLTGKLEFKYKNEDEKIFSIKCLLHIIVTVVVPHLLLNTKIMRFISIYLRKKNIGKIQEMIQFTLIWEDVRVTLMNEKD